MQDNAHDIYTVEVTIADGETEPAAATLLKENAIVGIETDGNFTGASLTLEMGSTSTTKTTTLDGSPVSVTIAANQFAPMNPQISLGCAYVKPIANIAQSGNDTVIKFLCRAY